MNGRGLAALLAALGALGTSSYYISSGVSGNQSNAGTPIATTSTSAAAVLAEPSAPTSSGVRCGKERWAVKTLTDADASGVNFTPVPSTITSLGSVAAPTSKSDLPRQPQEKNVYQVKGTIVGYKLEDDNDIHLAIADTTPPFATMIAEFPNRACDTGAVDQAQIDQARSAFEAAFPKPTKKFQTPSGCVTVTGVFFFDRIHGQLGGAPDDLRNLWPEPHTVSGDQGSFAKDKVENKLKRDICKGAITLAAAQQQIATDWRQAQ